MKGWRSARPSSNLLQPNLPGLPDPAEHRTRRLATPGEYALERAKARIVFAVLMFGIVYAVIAGRLADLTLLNEAPEAPVMRQALTGPAPTVARADIVDRNGTVLATSLPLFSLCADAKAILDVNEAVQKLRSVLPDLDPAKLREEFSGTKRCAPIKRHLTPRQYYAINKLGIAGLEFTPDEGRSYPAGHLTSHVLGYTDIDNHGIAGLEKSLNARLEQQPEPVATTLDIRLQTILHRELSQAVAEFDALGAAGAIMDATNGEILALVSLPDFDPQQPGRASDDAKFNRATLGVYEMGSTFKIFNTAMALDSGLVKLAERFDTTRPVKVGRKSIRDFHPADHPMNVAEIFVESSNIGSALMAERVGNLRQRAFLSRLGLMEKAPVELPEVGLPLVPPAANWGDATTMTVAFGHGIAVNAVQLVSAVATIVNEGVPVRPTLLKDAATTKPRDTSPVIAPRTAAEMRALMRLVVTEGTAKSAEVPGYMVGGKTGTADKLSGGKYAANARMSSFVGVFPVNAPRYIVFAILDDPKGNAKTYGFATGGWTVAPAVGRVISQMGPLLGLPPLEPNLVATAEQQTLRPLGNEVLGSLSIGNGADDYASVETDNEQ